MAILRLTSAAVPQRVRRESGEWAAIDLDLRAAGDGTLRPGASVADVRFSAGGAKPLVTLVRDGKSLTLGWQGDLPVPTVSGARATYSDVLPDVDLVVRATDQGFAHALVVKTPQAADEAKVRQIRFDLGGDAEVIADPSGRLQAVAGGVTVATASPAVMWDSAVPPVTGQRASASAADIDPSTPQAPGVAANIAAVRTTVDDDQLVLHPDVGLLSAPAASFPLYIDPDWQAFKAKWAYATNDNSNNTDTSVARVGKDPEGSRTYRSFFNFTTTFLNKKHIEDAYVQMEVDHSASCDATWTHMYHSGGIASVPRTKWSPALSAWLDAKESRAPEGAGCPGKADMTVNFKNAKLTAKMQEGASKSWGNMTFGFCACNETGQYENDSARWKKFFPNKALLIVDYASYPSAPVDLKIAGVNCPTTGIASIGTAEPVFTARYPDADSGDGSNQTLTASYGLYKVTATGALETLTPPGTRSVPAGSTATSGKLAGLVKGSHYVIHTRATDPAPYNLDGPWSSPWCHFTVDTTVPAPPTITVVKAPTVPGTAATVTLTSPNADVRKFYYGWDDLPLKSVNATGTTTKTATVSLTAARYGDLTLYAYAEDVTLNKGNNKSESFTVGKPSQAIARWGLESYPSVSEAGALNDAQPALGGDTPLAWNSDAPDRSWNTDARMIGGASAGFDRTKGGDGASASGPVPALDTSTSFSVAAWARIHDDATYQTVVSKEGAAMSVFRLMYRTDAKAWCMVLRSKDQKGMTGFTSCASPTLTKLGKWTHLAGVYDDVELRLKLYVDGRLASDMTLATPFLTDWAGGWNATGHVVVGRAKDSGFSDPRVDFYHGEIADVQIFDRALVDQDLVGQRADDPHSNGVDEPGMIAPLRVGRWEFSVFGQCPTAGSPYCREPDASGWARQLTLSAGTEAGEGISGGGLLLDDSHYDSAQTAAMQEYGLSQRSNAGVLQDTPVLRTDQAFSVSVWVRLDGTSIDQSIVSQDTAGTGFSGFDVSYRAADSRWVFAIRNGPAVTDLAQRSVVTVPAEDPTLWHHVVAIFDPGLRQLKISADGQRPVMAAAHAGLAPWQATGPLVVGRSDQPNGVAAWLHGSVDNVTVWQGIVTDAAVAQLNTVERPAAGTS